MNTHSRQMAWISIPLLIGVLIGLGWADSARAEEGKGKGKCTAAQAKKPQRFGSVIELRPEKKEYYLKLHANTWPTVLKRIRKSNIRNYSIYMAKLEGKLYLFSYFEYVGDDFDGDMAKIGEDPETQRWWKETDPCQRRLPGTPEGDQWLSIPEVFHTD